MSKQSKYQEFISKPELSFWVPIIFTAITVTSSFSALYTKVELLTQKVDTIAIQLDKIVDKYSDVEKRWGDTSQRVTVLETRAGIR